MQDPVVLTRAEFGDALIEAARLGAMQALESVGLHDEHAAKDITQLRDLLESWRLAKQTAMKSAVSVATKGLMVAMLLGIAYWLGRHGVKFPLLPE